jgi:hypothetical protein
VPKKGLEPPHPCGYMDLNHARLPIPPLRLWKAPGEPGRGDGNEFYFNGRLGFLKARGNRIIGSSGHRAIGSLDDRGKMRSGLALTCN